MVLSSDSHTITGSLGAMKVAIIIERQKMALLNEKQGQHVPHAVP